ALGLLFAARSRLPRARYVLAAFVRAPTAERGFSALLAGWRLHSPRRRGSHHLVRNHQATKHRSSWEPRPRGEAFGLAGRLAPAFVAAAWLPSIAIKATA